MDLGAGGSNLHATFTPWKSEVQRILVVHHTGGVGVGGSTARSTTTTPRPQVAPVTQNQNPPRVPYRSRRFCRWVGLFFACHATVHHHPLSAMTQAQPYAWPITGAELSPDPLESYFRPLTLLWGRFRNGRVCFDVTFRGTFSETFLSFCRGPENS